MNRQRYFGFLLKDVSRLSAKNFERHSSERGLGLGLAQCKVLIHLQRNQGVTQVQLAALTDTDPMTLVRILDRMEDDGWIERRPDPADRRVRRLHLTVKAAPITRQIWTIADRARAEAFEGLDEADQEQLFGLLQRIHDNLARRVPGAADASTPGGESADTDARPSPATKARAYGRLRRASSKKS